MLKITIKTRVWLLGLLLLGSLFLVIVLQYQISSEKLAGHGAMLARLEQVERLARLVQEVQKERGLTTAFLASDDGAARAELSAQRKATDFKLAESGHLQEGSFLSGLGPMREKIDEKKASIREAFGFYTFSLGRVIELMDRLSLESAGHPLQSDLFGLAHLIRAKEYLGQTRATLLAGPINGRVDPAWHAALGSRYGLFEASIEISLKEINPAMRETLKGALDEAEMQRAQRLIRDAMEGRPIGEIEVPRQRWFDTVTEGMNLLREVERYSLNELTRRAIALDEKARLRVFLQKSGLLALSLLLAWLAISSLRLLLQALESALQSARRATRKQSEGRRSARQHDETVEITQGFNELLDLVDQLNVKASTDALTGALNRHGFHEIANGELQRAHRYHRDLAMIIADIDHFKKINDGYGHPVGDRVLCELSRLIRENLRGADVFARWGGEEFIILTPETDIGDAIQLAEKLRLIFEAFRTVGLPVFTASFGVAGYEKGESLETLFAKADKALYRAKESGRNRVEAHAMEVAVPGETRSSRRHIRVVSDRSSG